MQARSLILVYPDPARQGVLGRTRAHLM